MLGILSVWLNLFIDSCIQDGDFKFELTDYSEDYQFGERDYLGKFSKACGIDISNMSEFYYCFEYLSYTKEEIILGIETRKRVKENYNIFICFRKFFSQQQEEPNLYYRMGSTKLHYEMGKMSYCKKFGKCKFYVSSSFAQSKLHLQYLDF